MEIGDKVLLEGCKHDRFVIQWIYENGFVEIRSLTTGEITPVQISKINPVT